MAVHLPASVVRASFADLINRVAYGGERVMVTRRDRAIAALVPVAEADLLERLAEIVPLDRVEEALKAVTEKPGPEALVGPEVLEEIRREAYEQARREVYEQVRAEAQKRLEALISGRRSQDTSE